MVDKDKQGPGTEQSRPATTEFLGISILTDQQKRDLFEMPNHGVTPVMGLRRYPEFSDWMKTNGAFGKNNYWMRFSSIVFGRYHQEMPWMQRFVALYPDQFERLQGFVDSHALAVQERRAPPVGEEQERDLWDAYEKLAQLVDVNDPYIDNKEGLPPGQAIPNLLTG